MLEHNYGTIVNKTSSNKSKLRPLDLSKEENTKVNSNDELLSFPVTDSKIKIGDQLSFEEYKTEKLVELKEKLLTARSKNDKFDSVRITSDTAKDILDKISKLFHEDYFDYHDLEKDDLLYEPKLTSEFETQQYHDNTFFEKIYLEAVGSPSIQQMTQIESLNMARLQEPGNLSSLLKPKYSDAVDPYDHKANIISNYSLIKEFKLSLGVAEDAIRIIVPAEYEVKGKINEFCSKFINQDDSLRKRIGKESYDFDIDLQDIRDQSFDYNYRKFRSLIEESFKLSYDFVLDYHNEEIAPDLKNKFNHLQETLVHISDFKRNDYNNSNNTLLSKIVGDNIDTDIKRLTQSILDSDDEDTIMTNLNTLIIKLMIKGNIIPANNIIGLIHKLHKIIGEEESDLLEKVENRIIEGLQVHGSKIIISGSDNIGSLVRCNQNMIKELKNVIDNYYIPFFSMESSKKYLNSLKNVLNENHKRITDSDLNNLFDEFDKITKEDLEKNHPIGPNKKKNITNKTVDINDLDDSSVWIRCFLSQFINDIINYKSTGRFANNNLYIQKLINLIINEHNSITDENLYDYEIILESNDLKISRSPLLYTIGECLINAHVDQIELNQLWTIKVKKLFFRNRSNNYENRNVKFTSELLRNIIEFQKKIKDTTLFMEKLKFKLKDLVETFFSFPYDKTDRSAENNKNNNLTKKIDDTNRKKEKIINVFLENIYDKLLIKKGHKIGMIPSKSISISLTKAELTSLFMEFIIYLFSELHSYFNDDFVFLKTKSNDYILIDPFLILTANKVLGSILTNQINLTTNSIFFTYNQDIQLFDIEEGDVKISKNLIEKINIHLSKKKISLIDNRIHGEDNNDFMTKLKERINSTTFYYEPGKLMSRMGNINHVDDQMINQYKGIIQNEPLLYSTLFPQSEVLYDMLQGLQEVTPVIESKLIEKYDLPEYDQSVLDDKTSVILDPVEKEMVRKINIKLILLDQSKLDLFYYLTLGQETSLIKLLNEISTEIKKAIVYIIDKRKILSYIERSNTLSQSIWKVIDSRYKKLFSVYFHTNDSMTSEQQTLLVSDLIDYFTDYNHNWLENYSDILSTELHSYAMNSVKRSVMLSDLISRTINEVEELMKSYEQETDENQRNELLYAIQQHPTYSDLINAKNRIDAFISSIDNSILEIINIFSFKYNDYLKTMNNIYTYIDCKDGTKIKTIDMDCLEKEFLTLRNSLVNRIDKNGNSCSDDSYSGKNYRHINRNTEIHLLVTNVLLPQYIGSYKINFFKADNQETLNELRNATTDIDSIFDQLFKDVFETTSLHYSMKDIEKYITNHADYEIKQASLLFKNDEEKQNKKIEEIKNKYGNLKINKMTTTDMCLLDIFSNINHRLISNYLDLNQKILTKLSIKISNEPVLNSEVKLTDDSINKVDKAISRCMMWNNGKSIQEIINYELKYNKSEKQFLEDLILNDDETLYLFTWIKNLNISTEMYKKYLAERYSRVNDIHNIRTKVMLKQNGINHVILDINGNKLQLIYNSKLVLCSYKQSVTINFVEALFHQINKIEAHMFKWYSYENENTLLPTILFDDKIDNLNIDYSTKVSIKSSKEPLCHMIVENSDFKELNYFKNYKGKEKFINERKYSLLDSSSSTYPILDTIHSMITSINKNDPEFCALESIDYPKVQGYYFPDVSLFMVCDEDYTEDLPVIDKFNYHSDTYSQLNLQYDKFVKRKFIKEGLVINSLNPIKNDKGLSLIILKQILPEFNIDDSIEVNDWEKIIDDANYYLSKSPLIITDEIIMTNINGKINENIHKQIDINLNTESSKILIDYIRDLMLLDPIELDENSSANKEADYMVDYTDAGSKKFDERTLRNKILKAEDISITSCMFKKEIILSFIEKHKELPSIKFRKEQQPLIDELGNYVKQIRGEYGIKANRKIIDDSSNYKYISFNLNKKVNDQIDPFSISQDKAACTNGFKSPGNNSINTLSSVMKYTYFDQPELIRESYPDNYLYPKDRYLVRKTDASILHGNINKSENFYRMIRTSHYKPVKESYGATKLKIKNYMIDDLINDQDIVEIDYNLLKIDSIDIQFLNHGLTSDYDVYSYLIQEQNVKDIYETQMKFLYHNIEYHRFVRKLIRSNLDIQFVNWTPYNQNIFNSRNWPKEKEQKPYREFEIGNPLIKLHNSRANLLMKKMGYLFKGSMPTMCQGDRDQLNHILSQNVGIGNNHALMCDLSGQNQSENFFNQFIFTRIEEEYYGINIPYLSTCSMIFQNLNLWSEGYYNPIIFFSIRQVGGIEGWNNGLWSCTERIFVSFALGEENKKIRVHYLVYNDDIYVIIILKSGKGNLNAFLIRDHRRHLRCGFIAKMNQYSITTNRSTILKKTYVFNIPTSNYIKTCFSLSSFGSSIAYNPIEQINSIFSSRNSALSFGAPTRLIIGYSWLRALPLILPLTVNYTMSFDSLMLSKNIENINYFDHLNPYLYKYVDELGNSAKTSIGIKNNMTNLEKNLENLYQSCFNLTINHPKDSVINIKDLNIKKNLPNDLFIAFTNIIQENSTEKTNNIVGDIEIIKHNDLVKLVNLIKNYLSLIKESIMYLQKNYSTAVNLEVPTQYNWEFFIHALNNHHEKQLAIDYSFLILPQEYKGLQLTSLSMINVSGGSDHKIMRLNQLMNIKYDNEIYDRMLKLYISSKAHTSESDLTTNFTDQIKYDWSTQSSSTVYSIIMKKLMYLSNFHKKIVIQNNLPMIYGLFSLDKTKKKMNQRYIDLRKNGFTMIANPRLNMAINMNDYYGSIEDEIMREISLNIINDNFKFRNLIYEASISYRSKKILSKFTSSSNLHKFMPNRYYAIRRTYELGLFNEFDWKKDLEEYSQFSLDISSTWKQHHDNVQFSNQFNNNLRVNRMKVILLESFDQDSLFSFFNSIEHGKISEKIHDVEQQLSAIKKNTFRNIKTNAQKEIELFILRSSKGLTNQSVEQKLTELDNEYNQLLIKKAQLESGNIIYETTGLDSLVIRKNNDRSQFESSPAIIGFKTLLTTKYHDINKLDNKINTQDIEFDDDVQGLESEIPKAKGTRSELIKDKKYIEYVKSRIILTEKFTLESVKGTYSKRLRQLTRMRSIRFNDSNITSYDNTDPLLLKFDHAENATIVKVCRFIMWNLKNELEKKRKSYELCIPLIEKWIRSRKDNNMVNDDDNPEGTSIIDETVLEIAQNFENAINNFQLLISLYSDIDLKEVIFRVGVPKSGQIAHKFNNMAFEYKAELMNLKLYGEQIDIFNLDRLFSFQVGDNHNANIKLYQSNIKSSLLLGSIYFNERMFPGDIFQIYFKKENIHSPDSLKNVEVDLLSMRKPSISIPKSFSRPWAVPCDELKIRSSNIYILGNKDQMKTKVYDSIMYSLVEELKNLMDQGNIKSILQVPKSQIVSCLIKFGLDSDILGAFRIINEYLTVEKLDINPKWDLNRFIVGALSNKLYSLQENILDIIINSIKYKDLELKFLSRQEIRSLIDNKSSDLMINNSIKRMINTFETYKIAYFLVKNVLYFFIENQKIAYKSLNCISKSTTTGDDLLSQIRLLGINYYNNQWENDKSLYNDYVIIDQNININLLSNVDINLALSKIDSLLCLCNSDLESIYNSPVKTLTNIEYKQIISKSILGEDLVSKDSHVFIRTSRRELITPANLNDYNNNYSSTNGVFYSYKLTYLTNNSLLRIITTSKKMSVAYDTVRSHKNSSTPFDAKTFRSTIALIRELAQLEDFTSKKIVEITPGVGEFILALRWIYENKDNEEMLNIYSLSRKDAYTLIEQFELIKIMEGQFDINKKNELEFLKEYDIFIVDVSFNTSRELNHLFEWCFRNNKRLLLRISSQNFSKLHIPYADYSRYTHYILTPSNAQLSSYTYLYSYPKFTITNDVLKEEETINLSIKYNTFDVSGLEHAILNEIALERDPIKRKEIIDDLKLLRKKIKKNLHINNRENKRISIDPYDLCVNLEAVMRVNFFRELGNIEAYDLINDSLMSELELSLHSNSFQSILSKSIIHAIENKIDITTEDVIILISSSVAHEDIIPITINLIDYEHILNDILSNTRNFNKNWDIDKLSEIVTSIDPNQELSRDNTYYYLGSLTVKESQLFDDLKMEYNKQNNYKISYNLIEFSHQTKIHLNKSVDINQLKSVKYLLSEPSKGSGIIRINRFLDKSFYRIKKDAGTFQDDRTSLNYCDQNSLSFNHKPLKKFLTKIGNTNAHLLLAEPDDDYHLYNKIITFINTHNFNTADIIIIYPTFEAYKLNYDQVQLNMDTGELIYDEKELRYRYDTCLKMIKSLYIKNYNNITVEEIRSFVRNVINGIYAKHYDYSMYNLQCEISKNSGNQNKKELDLLSRSWTGSSESFDLFSEDYPILSGLFTNILVLSDNYLGVPAPALIADFIDYQQKESSNTKLIDDLLYEIRTAMNNNPELTVIDIYRSLIDRLFGNLYFREVMDYSSSIVKIRNIFSLIISLMENNYIDLAEIDSDSSPNYNGAILEELKSKKSDLLLSLEKSFFETITPDQEESDLFLDEFNRIENNLDQVIVSDEEILEGNIYDVDIDDDVRKQLKASGFLSNMQNFMTSIKHKDEFFNIQEYNYDVNVKLPEKLRKHNLLEIVKKCTDEEKDDGLGKVSSALSIDQTSYKHRNNDYEIKELDDMTGVKIIRDIYQKINEILNVNVEMTTDLEEIKNMLNQLDKIRQDINNNGDMKFIIDKITNLSAESISEADLSDNEIEQLVLASDMRYETLFEEVPIVYFSFIEKYFLNDPKISNLIQKIISCKLYSEFNINLAHYRLLQQLPMQYKNDITESFLAMSNREKISDKRMRQEIDKAVNVETYEEDQLDDIDLKKDIIEKQKKIESFPHRRLLINGKVKDDNGNYNEESMNIYNSNPIVLQDGEVLEYENFIYYMAFIDFFTYYQNIDVAFSKLLDYQYTDEENFDQVCELITKLLTQSNE